MKKAMLAVIPIMLLFTGCSLYTQEDFDDIKDDCEAKVEDYEADIEDYKDQIAEYEDKMDEYAAEVTRLEDENEDYMLKIETMSEANEELLGEISEYEDLLVSNEDDYNVVYDEIVAMTPAGYDEELFVLAVLMYSDVDNYLCGESDLTYNQEGFQTYIDELDTSNYNDTELVVYEYLLDIMDVRQEIIDNGATDDLDTELEYDVLIMIMCYE